MVFVSHLLVFLTDEFPFGILRIKRRFRFARDLQTKQSALAFALAFAAALHFVVLVSRIDDIDIIQTAAAQSAHLITDRVFHAIDSEFAIQNRFHAETFVILFVRAVFGLTFVIGVRDVPRDVVTGTFWTLEELAVTTALSA